MLISLSHEQYIESLHVAVILPPHASPTQRLIEAAEEAGTLINATAGKSRKSVIVLTSGQVVLTSVLPKTLKERFDPAKKED